MWPQTDFCSYHNLLSFYTAKTVLAKLREDFVAEVNPSLVVSDLIYDGIINDGTLTESTGILTNDSKVLSYSIT